MKFGSRNDSAPDTDSRHRRYQLSFRPRVAARCSSCEVWLVYTPLKSLPRRDILLQQAPGAGASLLIAEAFYKFGSFSLEVLAFLGTWLIVDAIIQTARALTDRPTDTKEQA